MIQKSLCLADWSRDRFQNTIEASFKLLSDSSVKFTFVSLNLFHFSEDIFQFREIKPMKLFPSYDNCLLDLSHQSERLVDRSLEGLDFLFSSQPISLPVLRFSCDGLSCLSSNAYNSLLDFLISSVDLVKIFALISASLTS